MSIFALVIALAKDLPDVEGDTKYNVETFAAKFGVRKCVNIVTALLLTDYIGASIVGVFGARWGFRWWTMVGGHVLLGLWLVRRRRLLKSFDKGELQKFYKDIWSLFYSEYILYLLI